MKNVSLAGFLGMLLVHSAVLASGTVTLCDVDVQPGPGVNFETAVATGGYVTFACPPDTVIQITRGHNLTRPTEIDGGSNMITLDARDITAIFSADAESSPVVLRNITLRDGPSSFGYPGDGIGFGGIFFGPVELELRNVTVEKTGYPLVANSIKVSNSRFRDNSGTVLRSPTVEVQSSEFIDNRGSPLTPLLLGGEIDTGTATVDNSRFTNNGPVIWGGTIGIHNSHFTGNGRESQAGGALNIRGNAFVEKSIFTNNFAPAGGAIWLEDGELTIRRSTFEGNQAADYGGAIAIGLSFAASKIQLAYSHFRSNTARVGGAITLGRLPTRSFLIGDAVNFANNYASEAGGAVYAAAGEINLARVFFIGNQAVQEGGAIFGGNTTFDTTALANALIVRNVAQSGAAFSGRMLKLVNATVADNQGPTITFRKPGQSGEQAFLTLQNSIISNNAGANCSKFPTDLVIQAIAPNVQFPGTECGSSIPTFDPWLDSFYVPFPGSPVRSAGNNGVCLNPPVSGRDVYSEPRPQRSRCTIGAVEGTIERHAIRELRRSKEPSLLPDLLLSLLKVLDQ